MGKPLISDMQMRSMHAAMQALHAAKRAIAQRDDLTRAERFRITRYPIALLAGTLFQLRPADALVLQGPNPLADTLLSNTQTRKHQKESSTAHICHGTAGATALIAAGLALHQKSNRRANTESSVTLAILEKEGDLSESLRLAHDQLLPLVIILRGENSAVTRARARRSLVPAIPVDDTDTIAICRVVQESLIRARNGWSSVVIHALHLPGTADPMLTLDRHGQRHHLPPPHNRVHSPAKEQTA